MHFRQGVDQVFYFSHENVNIKKYETNPKQGKFWTSQN